MLLQRFKIHFNHRVLFSYLYKINILLILALMVLIAGLFFISDSFAAGFSLNTSIPKKSYNIPSGNLGKALATYSAQAGVVLVFDPLLTEGKQSPGLKGEYGLNEGFATLLKGSGLEVAGDGNGEYSLKRAKVVVDDSKNLPEEISLREIAVRAQRFYEVGPLPGLGLTLEQIPGNVQSISAAEIKESHSLSVTDLLNKKLQSVNVNDYAGNPFQMDVTYRGFTAGPQIGTPQGLSVFFDGIRVNEPFGDVVNWDMIPMNALASVDVFPGSNPIFGLNTLGGAFTVKTKDGFNHSGVDAELLTGSYGRKQLQVTGGWNNGTVALFGAGNFFMEDGWRQDSPSKVNQAFGKASYRGEKLDLNLSTLLVKTELVGNGLLPSQMYEQDRTSVFTSPDTTDNTLGQLQLSGSYFVSDTFTVTGQVYRRNSKRHQVGSDVFTDYKEDLVARRRPGLDINGDPEQYTCLLASTGTQGLPDYYLLSLNESQGQDLFTPGTRAFDFTQEYLNTGSVSSSFDDLVNVGVDGTGNTKLPDFYVSAQKLDLDFWRDPLASILLNRNGTPVPQAPTFINPFGFLSKTFDTLGGDLAVAIRTTTGNVIDPLGITPYFYTTAQNGDVIKNLVVLKAPTNATKCQLATAANGAPGNTYGGVAYTYKDANGNLVFVDGATGAGSTGVVEGTPTAIINDNRINQIVDGASVQLNWNLEKHKFMVGASIDAAHADYSNTSQLGFLDANRKAYLDPLQANPQFLGALEPISNNNFEGTNTTKSVYFSETWTPVKAWNFSVSGRYNETQTKNKIAARYGIGAFGLGDLVGVPDDFAVCNGDCTVNPPEVNYKKPRVYNSLDKAETEKFSFYSFNPSLGATWQARENLNVYGNLAQGTRTPSVIELGCALDKSSGVNYPDGNGGSIFVPKSVLENRQCTLPTTLSGDPYLPQIKATTYDIGMRGTLDGLLGTDRLKWNLGAYQTDLKDDIYFVAIAGGGGFFDSIGDTRRRGLEAGLSGRKDKWGFGINYGLTDATFQNNFKMISTDNSSATVVNGYGNIIQVEKDDRMPGVPLHNLNANVSYEITSKWRVGLTAIVHSESFVRGNENNEHKVGVQVQGRGSIGAGDALRQPTSNPGSVPGYATFNLQSSYRFNDEWTATVLVNNLFDREYFTAGRLGRNPFSPSINGAIGPDGYNHNSNDWLSTNFISPAAPRGMWVSLRYEFSPDKK